MKANELFSASARDGFAAPYHFTQITQKVNTEYPFKMFTTGNGIEVLQCDYKCLSNIRISLPSDISRKYVFLFNLNDTLHFSDENILWSIPKLHNMLYFNEQNSKMVFNFRKGNSYKFCLFLLKSSNFKRKIQDFVGENAQSHFNGRNLLYKAYPNLKITDHVYKLLECKKQFPENLICVGYINIIIGLLLSQYIDLKNGISSGKSCLREWEIAALQKISKEIRERPEQNYAIKTLAKQSGVSMAKLQEGFKEMHGHTIANFIREVRLLKGEELLKNSDLNVSEIVYSVGLCSRSYFSRIFKKKYKCTPTDYQRQQVSLDIALSK